MRDMIILGSHNDNYSTSSMHLIKCLRNIGRVIWVDIQHQTKTPYSASNQVSLDAPVQHRLNTAQRRHIFLQVNQVPYIHSPIDRQDAIQRILNVLKPVLKTQQISAPIIWTSELYIADLQPHLTGSSLVYYCDDESDARSQLAFEQEQTMVRNANVIFGSNDIICSRFPRNKTLLLPQAVDTELFCKPALIASDMPKQDKPIAGFYGDLDSKIDYQLLFYTALNLPTWNFVFLGKNTFSNYPLPKLNNIHYLGPKPHYELPRYSQHWQVSLLPYKKDAIIPRRVATTLLEYLAVGAPIVTTSASCVSSYNKYINVVESAHEMSEALKLAIYEQRTPSDLVISESCQVRSQFVSRILDSL